MRKWTCELVVAIGLLAIPGQCSGPTLADDPARRNCSCPIASPRPARADHASGSQSPTFRRMVETINASDGIVYIDPGTCRDGVRACLVNVSSAGGHRFLFVKVDMEKADHALMASIGHELQHAVEVLGTTRSDGRREHVFLLHGQQRPFQQITSCV